MYHEITAGIPSSGAAEYFAVSADAFDRQLDVIAALGFNGRSIAGVLREPARSVAISFDDGEITQATSAFPRLAARGMTATFFVTTGWIGTAGYASREQLREMHAAGMSIQSHTHTHPFLSELDEAGVRDELRRSRETLDELLGQRTTMLALPGGDLPRSSLRRLFREEGYDVVATSRWGSNAAQMRGAPRFVRRCTVRGGSDDSLFRATVSGDRWLSARKQLRESVLSFVRSSLGPSRYARLRRAIV